MKRIYVLGIIGLFTLGLSSIALADDNGQNFRAERYRQGDYRGNDQQDYRGSGYGNTRSSEYYRGNGYNYGNGNRASGYQSGYYRDVDYRRDARAWNAGYPRTIRRPDYDRDRGCYGRDWQRRDNRRYVR